MLRELSDRLKECGEELPGIRAYHRIDGPGSSLDLREFQQALWSVPPEWDGASDLGAADDPSFALSARLPRTVAITIDTGTVVTAEPFEKGQLCVESTEYETVVAGAPGQIPPTRANWLLKIVEAFGISGVKFVLKNLVDGTHSSGLGGSATATTAVALLANRLAGRPLDGVQIVGMASRMETELGVSLTGTQEQSNVVFGGVVDYVWCPWGEPGVPGSGYGSSIRSELIAPERYPELDTRTAIFHTGRARASSDTNAAWVAALGNGDQQRWIDRKLEAAYAYREGIRTENWAAVSEAIESYRHARTTLCADYMTGADEMHRMALDAGGVVFPLGAGGGGGVLVFHQDPDGLRGVAETLRGSFREIPFRLRATGHDFLNFATWD